MGKFIKTCLIVGVICIVAGIAASSAGIFNGGLPKLKEEVLNGEWAIGENATIAPFFELEKQHYFNEDAVVNVDMENVQDVFVAEDVYELHVKSAGVTVEFAEYDGVDIQVEATKVHKYQAYLENGELYIIARGQSAKNLGSGIVKVTVPGTVYDEGYMDVDIESAASVVSFDRLEAADVELNVSAGTIFWNDLTAQELSIEMAAGTVTGGNMTVTGESDIKVNAGTITIAGVLGTETVVEMAAGMVGMTLADAETDYNYDISCAGGSVTVGEEVAEGVAKTLEISNNAAKNIDVECSMGAVNIGFAN